MMKLFRNNSGMTLPEITVGLFIAGLVGVVTMKSFQEQAGNETYIKFTAAVNRATMEVQNAMSNNDRCNQMLAGETRDSSMWPNNTTTISTGRLAYKVNATDYRVMLQVDTEYAEGFYIPPNGIQLAEARIGGVANANATELILTFKTRNRALWKNNPTIKGTAAANQSTIVKRIPFLSTMAAVGSHVIKACGPVVSDSDIAAKKTMCDALGNAATWDGTSCQLTNMVCNAGEIPVEVESLGQFNCVPAAQVAMSEIFDFSSSTCASGQSVTLQPDSVTGKIKAVCVTPGGGLCPTGVKLTWKVDDNICTSDAVTPGGSINGTAFNASDATGPITGSLAFSCNDYRKTWVINGTPTCNNSSRNCAAGQQVRWAGNSKFCGTTSSAMTHEQTSTIYANATLSSPGVNVGTSKANVQCVNGVVAVVGKLDSASGGPGNWCD